MKTLCTNESCARAGWCKRFTYKKYIRDREYPFAFFSCSSADNFRYYVRNKAREIYERENPDDAYRDEKPESEEHPDNNRESRMREDNETPRRIEPHIAQRWCIITEPDSLLQFQRSSSGGSNQQGTDSPTGQEYFIWE